jgi:hypothetical protein
MLFLNLTLGQFLALFGVASALLVTLYLLDRARRRQAVATLRFWQSAQFAPEAQRRRRIQQPWSLLLQIVSVGLLLLAISQVQWGSPSRAPRDHVLILDTSSWMNAQTAQGTLMERARTLARQYVRNIPSNDRVMLVRADALATPATFFETRRETLEAAIQESEPRAAALQLHQAFQFATRTMNLHSRRPGEIVLVSGGRVVEDPSSELPVPANLRVLPVEAQLQNCGIRRMGLRQSYDNPDTWEVFVSVRNYGTEPRRTRLAVQFGGAIAGVRDLTIAPLRDQDASFQVRTEAAGIVEARLLTPDGLPDDNAASLEIPHRTPLRVAVFTHEPDLLRPILTSNPLVKASFAAPSQYRPEVEADIAIFDRCRPSGEVRIHSLWIEPPPGASPIGVKTVASKARLQRWRSDHPLGAGLRTRDLILDSAQVFLTGRDDVAVAEVEGGPVILARPGERRLAVMGFHPVRSAMRYELATPLLFANILHWMSPNVFRHWELHGGTIGHNTAELESGVDPAAVRVLNEAGVEVPFRVHDGHLSFFAGEPGAFRVRTPSGESVHSLWLPEVADTLWSAPPGVAQGVPPVAAAVVAPRELWHWLALLGALGLLTDWLLYGRNRRRMAALAVPSRGLAAKPARRLLRLPQLRRRAS